MPPHHKKKRAPKSAVEIARIGAAYCGKFDALTEICRRHRMSYDALVAMATAEGWPPRGLRAPRPNAQKSRNYKLAPRPRTEAQVREERRAEQAARELELYGRHVADVALLRRRGFGINREGDLIRFGNALITFAELREKADRERRLEAAARPPEPPRKAGRQPGTKMSAASKAKQAAAMRALWADKSFRRRTMSRQRQAMAARVEARA